MVGLVEGALVGWKDGWKEGDLVGSKDGEEVGKLGIGAGVG